MQQRTAIFICVALGASVVALSSLKPRPSADLRAIETRAGSTDALGPSNATPSRSPARRSSPAPTARVDAVTSPEALVAARERALRLKACADLLWKTPEGIRIEEQRRLAADKAAAVLQPGSSTPGDAETEARKRTEDRLAERSRCALLPPAEVAGWPGVLERLADRGDVDSARAYAWAVLSDSGDATRLFADLDEHARRKRKAFGYLQPHLAGSDCLDLTPLRALAPDAETAYALQAAAFARSETNPDPTAGPLSPENRAFLQGQLDLSAARLSAAQVGRARANATAIVSRCR